MIFYGKTQKNLKMNKIKNRFKFEAIFYFIELPVVPDSSLGIERGAEEEIREHD